MKAVTIPKPKEMSRPMISAIIALEVVSNSVRIFFFLTKFFLVENPS
jgi:hypothetical protein